MPAINALIRKALDLSVLGKRRCRDSDMPHSEGCFPRGSALGRDQRKPSSRLASSLMRSRVQGGDQTSFERTTLTPGTGETMCWTCLAVIRRPRKPACRIVHHLQGFAHVGPKVWIFRIRQPWQCTRAGREGELGFVSQDASRMIGDRPFEAGRAGPFDQEVRRPLLQTIRRRSCRRLTRRPAS